MAKIPDLNSTEKMIRGLYDDLFGAVTNDIKSKDSKAETPKTPAKPTAKPPVKPEAKSEPKPIFKKPTAPIEIPTVPRVDTDEINSMLQELNQIIADDLDKMDARKNSVTPTPAAPAAPKESEKPAEPETDPMDDLNALVGLTDLKKDVEELISLAKMQKMRQDQGMKSVPVSLHLVFSGNPGTGKTTVARILARLYKKIGVLSKGQLVECDRSSLVAGFVGQTATKTMDKINEAMGGVLFIDEAYTLVKEGGNDFGQEAIDTLLKAMEDHRDGFIVIVAGYTELMETFVNSNPGLKSRFNKYLFFPDYSQEELFKIFQGNLKKYQYTLGDGAEDAIKAAIQKMIDEKSENFANAREVRNLFEKIITRQATRIGKMEESEKKPDITLILKEDVTGEEYVEESPMDKDSLENTVIPDESEELTEMNDVSSFDEAE